MNSISNVKKLVNFSKWTILIMVLLAIIFLFFFYQNTNQYNLADSYYQLAINQSPNDEFFLLSYSKYLICNRNDRVKARSYLEQINSIQKNHEVTNTLLVVAISDSNGFNDLDTLLKSLQIGSIASYLAELKLYSNIEYLNQLLHLDKIQREKLGEKIKYFKTKILYGRITMLTETICQEKMLTNQLTLLSDLKGQADLYSDVLTDEQFIKYLENSESLKLLFEDIDKIMNIKKSLK